MFEVLPDAPTILQFVSNNEGSDVLACLSGGVPPRQIKPETHSFAVEGRSYFDNNVGDEIVTAEGIPERVRNYRLARYFVVQKRKGQQR